MTRGGPGEEDENVDDDEESTEVASFDAWTAARKAAISLCAFSKSRLWRIQTQKIRCQILV